MKLERLSIVIVNFLSYHQCQKHVDDLQTESSDFSALKQNLYYENFFRKGKTQKDITSQNIFYP